MQKLTYLLTLSLGFDPSSSSTTADEGVKVRDTFQMPDSELVSDPSLFFRGPCVPGELGPVKD